MSVSHAVAHANISDIIGEKLQTLGGIFSDFEGTHFHEGVKAQRPRTSDTGRSHRP